MWKMTDARQADQIMSCVHPFFGRRHRRNRNELIFLTVDRQQRYKYRLSQSPAEITAHAAEVIADERTLVLQGAMRAGP